MSEKKAEVGHHESTELDSNTAKAPQKTSDAELNNSSEHQFSAQESLFDFVGIGVVGVLLAALMPFVAQANGHNNEALNNLVKHVLTLESEVFAFAGIVAGFSLIFKGDGFANILWKHVCASFLGLAAHGAALASGVLLGLLIPIGFDVPGLPTYSPGLAFGTSILAALLFVVVFFFYIGFKGYYKVVTPKFTEHWLISKPCGLFILLVSLKYLFHWKFYGW